MGLVLGVLLMGGGLFMVAFPKAAVVPHQDSEDGNFLSRINERQCRIFGIVEIIFGAGFICASHWPGWGARRSAIDDYVWNLSQELVRHFGTKKYYDIEDVRGIAQSFGCDTAYIAYAHAMFCSRVDFDAYYGPLRVRCTYDGLRAIVGRRYFRRAYGFDAASVVRLATPPKPEEEHSFNGW
jgi:hypothetical protein